MLFVLFDCVRGTQYGVISTLGVDYLKISNWLLVSLVFFAKRCSIIIRFRSLSTHHRTADGEMFVVKDPDQFATNIIPQYFDHNKFSSFARQLNFYGFRKMQSKPIRNSDYDAGTAKHVTFFNKNFKRGRCDLLKKIQRSTRGGGSNSGQDQQREIQNLRDQVSTLEQKVTDLTTQFEDRVRRLELEMLSRMEQMMLTVQQQQQTQLQLQKAASIGSNDQTWEPNALPYPRGNSAATSVAVNTTSNSVSFQQPQQRQPSVDSTKMGSAPTLPPHPKQKQLPVSGLPGAMGAPPDRLNSLRGISTLSRGLSGLSRGASIESSASAVLMRNSWEDKFFSMLMLDGTNDAANNTGANNTIMPTPIGDNNNAASSPPVVSNRSEDFSGNNQTAGDDDLSDVSSTDMQ